MRTQIKCPQCAAPAAADVYQIIDIDREPELKQLLMSGALNVAQCRNCGWYGQVAMPLVYHESAHDLLISFVPMELNLPYAEQERMMGQLVRRVVENVPAQKRRAYLLQPQQMFRWQTFVERVLETEGITREMLERQRRQMDLLQTLARADAATVEQLFAERADDLDETFIAMVQATLQQAAEAQQEQLVIALSNVQARLMRATPAGRRVEKRQLALHAMNRDAQAEGGASPQVLLKHVLRHQADDDVVDALVAASGALSYEFFAGLSAAVDDAARAGDAATVNRLTDLRTRLLKLYDDMRAASEKALSEARELVKQVAAAADKPAALQAASARIDDLFLMALEQELAQARQDLDLARSSALQEVQRLIEDALRHNPQVQMQFITGLLQAPSETAVRQMLDENADLINEDLLMLFDMLGEQAAEAPPQLQTRLKHLRALIAGRVLSAQRS